MLIMTLIGWVIAIVLSLFIFAVIRGFRTKLFINHTWDATVCRNVIIKDDRENDPFMGLALSGGGGRAAVFAAEGMRVLAEHGYLEKVTHVSSVSGGGFAASYLATHPLPSCEDRPALDAYFDRLHAILARDFVSEIVHKQLWHPSRLFSPSRRLDSLQEVLEDAQPDPRIDGSETTIPYLGGKAFSDIDDGRRYYFNTISYDFGQRFTLSNAAIKNTKDLDGHPMPEIVRTMSFSRATEAFSGLHDTGARSVDPDFPISLAVAISAAFPPVMGPASIEVVGGTEKNAYWHLGDGGVLENTGVETLREAYFTHMMHKPSASGGLIFSFDAGLRLEGVGTERRSDISLWSPWTPDATRLVDSILQYAGANRKAFEETLSKDPAFAINEVSFAYLTKIGDRHELVPELLAPDALERLDLALEKECAKEGYSSALVATRIREIETSYTITRCNAVLMKWAARELVEAWIAEQST